MLGGRARPGFVCAPLTNPGLRTTNQAHITVYETPCRLFERHTCLLRTESGQGISIDGIREHHITVQKKRPCLCSIPPDCLDPLLALYEGFGTTDTEILEREGEDSSGNIVCLHPVHCLFHRIVRRPRVTDNNRVHLSFHRVHETFNNPRLILDHAQKNNPVV